MASIIYNSCPDDVVRGNINFASDTFKQLLVTSAYTPDQSAHLKRSDITNEVSGTGYSAGGVTVTATVAKNTSNKTETISFSAPSWANATITAKGAVIYKSRGGASSADELVAFIDFGSSVSSSGGTFSVSSSTITLANNT